MEAMQETGHEGNEGDEEQELWKSQAPDETIGFCLKSFEKVSILSARL